MNTLLTFEVFEETATKDDADKFRREIESLLGRSNWRSVGIHTTFTLDSKNSALIADLSETFKGFGEKAYGIAGIRVPIKMRYTYLQGSNDAMPHTWNMTITPGGSVVSIA